ncbi:hypothetical protein [Porphyrobacter sp. GA68]|uniref:hypothetical protein n=1 Tax=Porphyrobacter sp. GA68 TaxID=2883480 RepID=UPI001D18EEBD|nr:hypothetical protein [Porphyrobacter sp. GA68]
MKKTCGWLLPLATIVAVAPLAAQDSRSTQRAVPPPLQSVLDCRALSDSAARLACFDQRVAALASATEQGQVAVVAADDVRAARRSLFGLPAPSTPLFAGLGDAGEEPESVSGVIRSVQTTRSGAWLIQIDEAVWQTTQSGYFQSLPRVGQEATVTRGLLGSYRLSVEGRAGLRTVRVR